MLKTQMTLRDLLAAVVTGSTVSIMQDTTAQSILASIVTDDITSLKVSLGGGGTVTFTNLYVTGDLTVSGNTYQSDAYVSSEYFVGPKDVEGSWRFYINGINLEYHRLENSVWVKKGEFIA